VKKTVKNVGQNDNINCEFENCEFETVVGGEIGQN
jgi:hypothetical protein